MESLIIAKFRSHSKEEMRAMKTILLRVLIVTASLTLSGCWESSDITIANAGQYKGARDPLLSQNTASRAESLSKRFQLIQMDR